MQRQAQRSGERNPPPPAAYLRCYALFFVLLALCYGVFQVWRITTPMIVVLIIGDGESTPAIYGVLMLLVAFALFALVMAGEPYLRRGLERGELGMRFISLAGPAVGLAALGLALQEVLRFLL